MKAVSLFTHAFIFTSLLSLSLNSHAYMVNDTYMGGNDNGWGDVIGDSRKFDTDGLNVYFSGSIITVDIFTNFANTDAIGSFSGLTSNGLGIGSGDLFLSNSYSPFGTTPNYLQDNAATGTLWQYGLSIDDAYRTSGTGAASLYKLNGSTNDSNALLSDDFLSGGVFRNGQEVAVDTQSSSTSIINSTGLWSVDTAAKKISFSFDTTGTDLLSTGELALHWAMLCGNDVIEGVVSAPINVSEPSIAALLGLGLLGLGFARRRV